VPEKVEKQKTVREQGCSGYYIPRARCSCYYGMLMLL